MSYKVLHYGEVLQKKLVWNEWNINEHQDDLYVVSARDMSKKERNVYYEQAKTNKTIRKP